MADKTLLTKAASDALKLVPQLVKQNAALLKENTELKREKRIAKLAGLLVDKKQIGEHELPVKIAELSEKTDEELGLVETALNLISPSGAIKLGSVVGGVNNDTPAAVDATQKFEQFLLAGGDESGE